MVKGILFIQIVRLPLLQVGVVYEFTSIDLNEFPC